MNILLGLLAALLPWLIGDAPPGAAAWTTAITSAAALIGAALLLQGCRPDLVAGLLWMQGIVLHQALPLQAGLARACTLVAALTLVLLCLPRGHGRFARRLRLRWHHFAFVLIVGPVAVAALAPGTAPGSRHLPVTGAALLASLAAAALLPWLIARFQEPAHRGARIPAEALRAVLATRRLTRRLQREGARQSQALQESRVQASQLQQALHAARTQLATQQAQLQRLTAAHTHVAARLQVLMAQCRDAVLFADAQGVVLAASPASQALLGFAPAALVGRPLRTLIPGHHVTPHALDHPQAVTDPAGTEAEIATADGQTRNLMLRAQAFDAGPARQLMVLLHDTAGLRRAMATLEQARMLERSAHQSRDLFIATMSHELRTPLHGLIATLDMMRADEHLPPEFEHRLTVARISARALLRIANDILDLTRIDSGHLQLERKPFALQRIVEEVVDESQARADSLGLRLAWRGGDTLPRSFIGDPSRLKQVLGNLVSNALQYTQAGGVTVEVRHAQDTCTIDVIDTGSGIPAESWQSIFDPFVQVASTRNRRVGGTGLGLPISRRLIEAMGGTLTLARSDARGSVFRIEVPLQASDEDPPEEQSLRIFSNPRGRVLVVEDNPANRYVAEALLSSLECPVTLVESGEEALETLADNDFDLILMDCQMPGMDGYETTRRARRLLKTHVPIIAMTANAMRDDQAHCLDAGMDDFLGKPFGRQALHAMLCKWLDPGAKQAATTEAAVRVAALPALDLSVFEELRESLQWRQQPLRNLRNTFASSARSTLTLLEGATLPDTHALRRHLHTLLGSAGMVGARQVEYLAHQLQAGIESGDRRPMEPCLALLREALRQFEIEFDRRLEESSAERDWTGRLQGTGRSPAGRA